MGYTDRHYSFVLDFLCVGSSAALLSITRVYPQLWFVSLFALIPFLWRATRVSVPGSIGLGSILAMSYCLVTIPLQDWLMPGICLPKLAVLNLLFSLYGVIINRMGKHVGINAVGIAACWLPLEYLLTRYAGMDGILNTPGPDATFFIRIGSLFGILFISFMIILINTLILYIITRIFERHISQPGYADDHPETICAPREIAVGRHEYAFPNRRAPPVIPIPVIVDAQPETFRCLQTA
jgi:apolipoprotein N-acyltransferase